jgi:probable blue pigment (indigoidine) exporter
LTPDAGNRDRTALAMFVALAAVSGGNFVAVRYSNAELAPYWGAALRFVPASALLLAAMAWWRVPLPRGSALRDGLLYGIFAFGIGYALAYQGLVAAPAGAASVMLATTPLITHALSVAQRVEAFSVRAVGGALIALAGVSLVFREQIAAGIPPVSLLLLLASAGAAAEAAILAKRMPAMHPLATNAVGMIAGVGVLLALSAAIGEPRALPSRTETWLAVAYLCVAGGVGQFALFLALLDRWTPSATEYVLVVTPVVAFTLGAVMRGEAMTSVIVVGAVLVTIGVYVGALSRARDERRASLRAPRTDSRRRGPSG